MKSPRKHPGEHETGRGYSTSRVLRTGVILFYTVPLRLYLSLSLFLLLREPHLEPTVPDVSSRCKEYIRLSVPARVSLSLPDVAVDIF